MSVAPYPEYKDSGVEWIGAVPAHWNVVRFKTQIICNDGGVWGNDPDGNEDTIVLRSTEQTIDGRWRIEDPAMRKLSAADIEAATLREGDLLITKSSGSSLHIGKTTLVTREIADLCCCYSNFMQRVRLGNSYSPRLAWYVLNNDLARLQFDLFSNSSTGLANLNGTLIGNILIAVAPPDEQSAIAAFLDQETGKIDALVAEQERLIALLKEKRQAVISQAVTKGLNPNAPMKDSGIEWLGQVPAHWETRKVSHLFRAGKGKNGQMLTKEFCAANEGPYPVYSGQTEDEGVMGTWYEFEFDFGEIGVLFCTTVGARAMHLKQLYGRFSLSQNCMIVWPTDSRCITRFFFYHFQPLFQWERSLIPDHMQPSFRMEDLYSFSVCIPPITEQNEIFEFLDRETQKIDTLITEATQAITLLRERRAALISAAVTGKIDVRSLAPTKQEAA